jgi:hypothetical protein
LARGYSAVGFYNELKWAVPRRRRPRVTRIRYSSPGIIELGGLVVSVAVLVEKVIRTICNAAKDANRTYSVIYRDMQKRKLLRIKTENEIRRLTATENRVIGGHSEEMADILNVGLRLLNERTGSSYKSLKILPSLFRRSGHLLCFRRTASSSLSRPTFWLFATFVPSRLGSISWG